MRVRRHIRFPPPFQPILPVPDVGIAEVVQVDQLQNEVILLWIVDIGQSVIMGVAIRLRLGKGPGDIGDNKEVGIVSVDDIVGRNGCRQVRR